MPIYSAPRQRNMTFISNLSFDSYLERPFSHVADPDERGGGVVKIKVTTSERDDFEKWFHCLDDLAGRELRRAFSITPVFILVTDERQPLTIVL